MAIFDDGAKAFLEAYTYFSNLLGRGMEKTAKKFAEEATGVKAPEKLEPVIPGNEVIRIPSKVEKGELMSINSTFSDPLKSDFVLSKIDGTAGSKYSVLRSETERMFPQFTQDLQYIKDNNIALTTIQKNNIINNLRLKRSLQTEVKKLETNLIADKKDPQMIFQAYTSASSKSSKLGYQQSTYPEGVERGSMAAKAIDESEIYKKNQLLNKKRLEEGFEMFKGFEPKVIEGGKGMPKSDDLFDKDGVLDKDAVLSDITETLKSRVPKKAGQGRFTKAQVLIERLKNTLKTDKDPYVQENFPNFIKELEAKPELANNKNVFDTLGGPLPKNQRLVEYDDGTVDFYTQGGKGGKGMESADLLAKDLGISLDEAVKIKMMEPEDQILEIQRRKTLMERETPIVRESLDDEAVEIAEQKILDDENVIDIEDYFDKDDFAKGGIVSIR